ncbi:MAG: glycosyltransferase [Candidatus Peribacteraceae bacterium]|nr:glycosyltransferase [Candidatus Peribacteraceae bacterium]
MRLLLAGGGSVGHIAPAVAVARACLRLDPSTETHMLCSRQEEELAFLDAERLPHTPLPRIRRSLSFPLDFLAAYRRAGTVFDAFRPDILFCTGGGMSVPVALRARKRGIPYVLLDADARGGRANALLSRQAAAVCHGFPTERTVRGNHVYTGYPVRPQITGGTKEEGLRLTGFDGKKPVLLVLGGSQGAESLNNIVIGNLPELLPLCDVAHVTGRGKSSAAARPGYWSVPFATKELPHLYAAASMALSRAGAGGIGELAANGIPAMLVPLRGVAGDHQSANARAAADGGGFLLLHQETLATALVPAVRTFLTDGVALERMKAAMRSSVSARPDAAEEIARLLLETGRAQRRGNV